MPGSPDPAKAGTNCSAPSSGANSDSGVWFNCSKKLRDAGGVWGGGGGFAIADTFGSSIDMPWLPCLRRGVVFHGGLLGVAVVRGLLCGIGMESPPLREDTGDPEGSLRLTTNRRDMLLKDG